MRKRNLILIISVGIIIAVSMPLGIFYILNTSNIQDSFPSARYGHTMVYIPTIQKVFLFGGYNQEGNLNDTWTYDYGSNKWTQITSTTNPSARSTHAMTYDSVNEKVILFGGWGSTQLNDTWIFDVDSNQWNEVFPSNSPPIRWSPGMYFDSDNQKAIVYGGYRESGSHLNDTWSYDYLSNTWAKLNITIAPEGRYGPRIVYIPLSQQGVLFGGRVAEIGIMQDTWTFNYTSKSWEKLIISNKPSTRYWYAMVYDSSNQKIVIFGGRHAEAPGEALSDTWIFNIFINEWASVYPSNSPSRRMLSSMVYDSYNNKTILFGGFRFFDTFLGDTWVYDYDDNNWYLMKGTDI